MQATKQIHTQSDSYYHIFAFAAFRLFFALSLIIVLLTIGACSKRETDEQKFSRLMTEAKTAQDNDKLDEARIKLQNALDLQQNNPDVYFELGEVLTQAKQFSKALENYRTALNLKPDHREARLRVATFMVATGEYEGAESDILKLLSANPNDPEVILLQSGIDVARGKFDDAKAKLEKALKISPDYAAAIASLGDIAQRQGDAKKAEELFKQALAKDPKSAPIRIALADLYSRLGQFKETEEIITAVLKDNPNNSSLRYFFAEYLLERGQADRALSEYKIIVADDPMRHDARDRLIDSYINKNQQDDARNLCNDFISAYPNEVAADYYRGRLAEFDRKHSEALQFFIKALTTMTNFAPVFRRAALAELALGKQSEGLEHLNQAIAIDPFDVGARITLAREAFFKRDFGVATEHINKILLRHPRQIGANIIRADIALIEGDLKTAEAIYKVLAEAFPKSPIPFFKLALLSEKAEKKEDAINYYQKAISFDQDAFLSINRLAHLLVPRIGFDETIKQMSELKAKSTASIVDFNVIIATLYRAKPEKSEQDINTARSLYEAAVSEKPGFMPAYFGLAELDHASGNIAGAISRYEQITKEQPKNMQANMLLALTYESQKEYSKAADIYKRIIGFAPTFAPALNNLAWLMVDQLGGNLDEALQYAQTAKREQPNEAGIADTLGWIYYKQGSSRVALTTLEEAVQLDSVSERQNPEILYHLAIAQSELQNKETAKKNIEKALKLSNGQHPKHQEMEKFAQTLK